MCIRVGMPQYFINEKNAWLFESEVDYDEES